HVLALGRSRVVAGRTDNLVVGPLLENMGAPAGNATGGENAGKQLSGDPHVVLQARRVEIDVTVLLDRFLDGPFERDRNLVPFRLFLLNAEPAGELFEVHGARVFDLI